MKIKCANLHKYLPKPCDVRIFLIESNIPFRAHCASFIQGKYFFDYLHFIFKASPMVLLKKNYQYFFVFSLILNKIFSNYKFTLAK
jgi:hypothetical protein